MNYEYISIRWLKRLVLLLVILVTAVVAMNQFTPPDIVPASASLIRDQAPAIAAPAW